MPLHLQRPIIIIRLTRFFVDIPGMCHTFIYRFNSIACSYKPLEELLLLCKREGVKRIDQTPKSEFISKRQKWQFAYRRLSQLEQNIPVEKKDH